MKKPNIRVGHFHWWSCRVRTFIDPLGNILPKQNARGASMENLNSRRLFSPSRVVLGAALTNEKAQHQSWALSLVELPGTTPGSAGLSC